MVAVLLVHAEQIVLRAFLQKFFLFSLGPLIHGQRYRVFLRVGIRNILVFEASRVDGIKCCQEEGNYFRSSVVGVK